MTFVRMILEREVNGVELTTQYSTSVETIGRLSCTAGEFLESLLTDLKSELDRKEVAERRKD